MSTESGADLRRVTLVAPHGRFDVALPATVPLAYLVPTLLDQAGEQLADSGVAHGGWVVQRLAGWPFDTAQNAAALGIADGEVLYLRPRHDELPTPVFDDPAEAIGVTLAERTARWTPAATRGAAAAAAGVLLAAGAVALTVAGPPWRAPFVGAAVAAVLLLGTSGLVSRAAGDAVFGAVLGCGAGVYGALAGALGLARDGGAAGHGAFTAPGVLAGASVGLLVVLLAGVSVGAGAHVFLAAVAVAVAGVAAGLVAPHTPSPSGGGAAAALVVVFLLVPLVPLIAYRAARLPRPFLPTSARELREGGSLTPGEELSERTLTADRFVTALTAACALVTAATATPLVRAPGWGGPPLVAAGCVLALLRTRLFTGLAQRLWLLAGSLVALGQLMVGLAGRHPGGVATAVAAGGAVLATAVLAGAGGAAGKPSPAAARLLGVAEVLAAIAVVPLALEVLGVYARLRSLTG